MASIIPTNHVEGSHWYSLKGEPVYTQVKKDGGLRPTTLADARKQSLLPSVTTILKVLHKPGLERWKLEQVALAVATTPRLDGESVDDFVARCVTVEAEQEGQTARDLGTDLHYALENLFVPGRQVDPALLPFVKVPYETMMGYGKVVAAETVVVGNGYAGKVDLVMETPLIYLMWDYKTCKKLPPKEAWFEHQLQLSAYARAWQDTVKARGLEDKPVVTGNVYISTQVPGEFCIYQHEDIESRYWNGFAPLVKHWQYANNYYPSHEN